MKEGEGDDFKIMKEGEEEDFKNLKEEEEEIQDFSTTRNFSKY
jgi:hypothetical protein